MKCDMIEEESYGNNEPYVLQKPSININYQQRAADFSQNQLRPDDFACSFGSFKPISKKLLFQESNEVEDASLGDSTTRSSQSMPSFM